MLKEKLFAPSVETFARYSHARRVLQIEPSGQPAYQDGAWRRELFQSLVPPKAIDEIWSVTLDHTDFDEMVWVIERLHPSAARNLSALIQTADMGEESA